MFLKFYSLREQTILRRNLKLILKDNIIKGKIFWQLLIDFRNTVIVQEKWVFSKADGLKLYFLVLKKVN